MQNKRKIARYYRKRGYGFFIPPGSKKKAIEVEPKLENLEEIDKIIRQPGKMPKGAYFRG